MEDQNNRTILKARVAVQGLEEDQAFCTDNPNHPKEGVRPAPAYIA